MHDIAKNISAIRNNIPPYVELLCVSKFQPVSAIMTAYNYGERHFGESRAQELVQKAQQLPSDIKWHFIGHLQTNKIKAILPFVWSIDSVDSEHLLDAIESEAHKTGKKVNVLLEMRVAQEGTKTGWEENDLAQWVEAKKWQQYEHIHFAGLMGMATNTSDENKVRSDFHLLSDMYDFCRTRIPDFKTLSMGMSGDYPLAIEEDATQIRIGSLIFGEREYA